MIIRKQKTNTTTSDVQQVQVTIRYNKILGDLLIYVKITDKQWIMINRQIITRNPS